MAMPVPISAAVASGRARANKEGLPRGAARAGGREAKPMAAGWTERVVSQFETRAPSGRPRTRDHRCQVPPTAPAAPRHGRDHEDGAFLAAGIERATQGDPASPLRIGIISIVVVIDEIV